MTKLTTTKEVLASAKELSQGDLGSLMALGWMLHCNAITKEQFKDAVRENIKD